MVQCVAVTTSDRQLWAKPSIRSQLPVTLPNGARWMEFEGCCAKCNAPIEAGRVHGTVSFFHSAIVINAIGVCIECKLFTRFAYRLHDDMSLSGQKDGKWVRWTPQTSTWHRICGGVRKALGLNRN